ncbi:hypothetical protein KN63_01790 [Smithella sp. F21]|nr:hypothetical protein KN63_01790 [Smithella sp. F21]
MSLLFVVYIIWAFFTGIFNYFTITKLSSIEISGIALFFKNIVLLFFYFYISIFSFNALRNNKHSFSKIRKVCLYSFLIVVPYALLEIFSYYFENISAAYLLNYLEPIFHDRAYSESDSVFRVRGYAFEPSYFSLYIAFVSPWLFSYLINFSSSKFKPFSLLILLFTIIIFTKSRITYVVFFIEFASFVFLAFRFRLTDNFKKEFFLLFLVMSGMLVMSLINYDSIFLTIQSLTSFESKDISNIDRLASIHSAFLLGFDHTIFGVGYGLAGAYLPDYYPNYAFLSYQMTEWASAREKCLGAPVFSMLPRLIAETGFIGCALFLGLWFTAMIKTYKKMLENHQNNLQIQLFGISLFVAFLGMFVASFSVDGYGFTGYWLSLGMAMAYVSGKCA